MLRDVAATVRDSGVFDRYNARIQTNDIACKQVAFRDDMLMYATCDVIMPKHCELSFARSVSDRDSICYQKRWMMDAHSGVDS